MKIAFGCTSLLIAACTYSQTSSSFDSTINFLQIEKIKINQVTPPEGFKVFYNCDSLLFMRGDFGDTIKIWTSGLDWYQDLEQFKEITKQESFETTQFVKNIDTEGRIFVSTYHQTEFIYRNDSLFEIQNSNPIPSGPFSDLFTEYLFKKTIDKNTYKLRLDSLHKIEIQQAIYTPKLIFTRTMFQKSKKVKLSKELNFERDTIILENHWVENGKNCYVVRINNKEDGQETSYAYAINEDLKFIYWEGCEGK